MRNLSDIFPPQIVNIFVCILTPVCMCKCTMGLIRTPLQEPHKSVVIFAVPISALSIVLCIQMQRLVTHVGLLDKRSFCLVSPRVKSSTWRGGLMNHQRDLQRAFY